MAKKEKELKTNAMRLLDQAGISYKEYFLENAEGLSGTEVAEKNGEPVDRVFKTLVTVGKSKEHYVFVIPVASELDLKKAANAVGEKNIEMIKSKELLGLTGYIHGGCSPIGMKKYFKTTIDEIAQIYDSIWVSGGAIGLQVEITPQDLEKIIKINYSDLCK